MAKKNQYEDRGIRILGRICDGCDAPIAGIRGALLQGHQILSEFTTDSVGDFSAIAPGATHVAFSSFFDAGRAKYLLMASRAVMEIPDDCDEEWTVPPILMQEIAGDDCITGGQQLLGVTSCGQPVDGFPLVGLDANQQAQEIAWTIRGLVKLSNRVASIVPAASAVGGDGATYTYSGQTIADLRDLAGQLQLGSSSTRQWISGRVVTDCGEPIAGVCVLLLDANKVLVTGGKAVTNAEGEFRFDAQGDYVVFGTEHRDACSKCCLHLVTDAMVAVPDAAECGRRTVPTAIYDGCCLVKPQPSGKIVRGKVLDNCNSVLNEACVLLMKNGQPVAWTKTVGGGYQFEDDGDTVVFCPEFTDRGRTFELLTPTLVSLPCPNAEGVREAPAAIYSGHCVRETPPTVMVPADRSEVKNLLELWTKLQQSTKSIRNRIASAEKLFVNDRVAVLNLLDGALAVIESQLGAIQVQLTSPGTTDAAFVAGSRKVLAQVEGQLKRIASTAGNFVTRGQGQTLSAAKVLDIFRKEIAEGVNQ